VGPAVLLSVKVTTTVMWLSTAESQPFTGTGVYSDPSTLDLTNVVTWSASTTGLATISNSAGSRGLAIAVGEGATTVPATDPSSLIEGAAALAVAPGALSLPPGPPAPSGPVLSMVPWSGKKRTAAVAADGANLAPGSIPGVPRAGRQGKHTVVAKVASAVEATTSFTLHR